MTVALLVQFLLQFDPIRLHILLIYCWNGIEVEKYY